MFGGSVLLALTFITTIAHGEDVGKAFSNVLQGCFLTWAFFSFVFYEAIGMFEELNKPRRPNQDNKPDSDS